MSYFLSIPAYIKGISSQTAISLSISPTSVYVNAGDNVILSCISTGLALSDIVWRFYPTSSGTPTTVIYFNGLLVNSSYSFSYSFVGSSLITNISWFATYADNFDTYQCTCNIYAGCSAYSTSTPAVNVSITAISKNNFTNNTVFKRFYRIADLSKDFLFGFF